MPLSRILEPEVMDHADDARDYDSMDHRQVNRRFVEDLFIGWSILNEGEALTDYGLQILDLGTGTAQIPIELCSRGGRFTVTAVDMAQSMLDLAAVNIERAGLADRVRLVHRDAKGLAPQFGPFDLVMSNSIVHHIPEPQAVLAEAARVCGPGGMLMFRDLSRPDDLATLRHLVAIYAADCNPHQRQLFADSLHAALTLEEVQQMVSELGFSPESAAMTSDRHWTWLAKKPV